MGGYIPQKPLAQNKRAVDERIKRLTDDKYDAMSALSHKKSRAKTAERAVLAKVDEYKKDLVKCNGSGSAIINRIKHHLSKGRDAGRIATWENLRVSEVQKIIEEISKESQTKS